jgi:uncharacterized protein (TIGR02271 family)
MDRKQRQMQASAREAKGRARQVRTRGGRTASGTALADGRTLVTFEDGRSIVAPEELLALQPDGTYLLDVADEDLGAADPRRASPATADGRSGAHEEVAVIPVIREELDVRKSLVETGRGVRIRKHVTERTEEVVQLLYREDLDVQHVPRNEIVDRPPPVRHEGTTMVIPLCEEVLVIEKRLLLKEEVHVRRREDRVRHAEAVVLRSEHAAVERFGEPDTAPRQDRSDPGGKG